MTLLGNFALWVALLFGIWGAALAFSGRWQDRPEMALSVTRSVYAIFAALRRRVASRSGRASSRHDFNIEYVWAYTSRNLPRATSSRRSGPGRRGRSCSGRWCSRSSARWRRR